MSHGGTCDEDCTCDRRIAERTMAMLRLMYPNDEEEESMSARTQD